MPNVLDISIALDGGAIQSIVIDGWPPDVPFPRIELIDHDTATADAEPSSTRSAEPVDLLSMATHLPDAVAHLRALGIELVYVDYEGSQGKGHLKLNAYQPSKQHDHPAAFISQKVANEIKAFFHSILLERHPDCFDSWGSSGVFRWFINPEKLVHRHESGRFDSKTFIYHGL